MAEVLLAHRGLPGSADTASDDYAVRIGPLCRNRSQRRAPTRDAPTLRWI